MIASCQDVSPIFFGCWILTQQSLAIGVIICAKHVGSNEQLMQVYERTDQNEGTQYTPEPKAGRAKTVREASSTQLIANSIRNLVIPDENGNTECERGKDERHKTKVHGLLAVIAGRNDIDIIGNGRHDDKGVDTKGDE